MRRAASAAATAPGSAGGARRAYESGPHFRNQASIRPHAARTASAPACPASSSLIRPIPPPSSDSAAPALPPQ